MGDAANRFVLGLEGPAIGERERGLLSRRPPFGVLLFARNLESAEQAVALTTEIRGLADPAPLLFVDQEGGSVDRLGPLLPARFPSATTLAEKGTDRVHENAFLMGRAMRLLGFDVDFAPCVDLGPPDTAGVFLRGRTFGFHAEDVVLCGMVFLHGLARAGMGTCLKHFPGLGRGAADTHLARPVIDAHDVDLMVTDVAPFAKLARSADGVMVGHAAYPDLTKNGDAAASVSPRVYATLRGPVGFDGVVYSDDLTMGALGGTLPERCAAAASAGSDVLVVARGIDEYEAAFDAVAAASPDDGARNSRLASLRRRCARAPRPSFTPEAWAALGEELLAFLEVLERPREKRDIPDLVV